MVSIFFLETKIIKFADHLIKSSLIIKFHSFFLKYIRYPSFYVIYFSRNQIIDFFNLLEIKFKLIQVN